MPLEPIVEVIKRHKKCHSRFLRRVLWHREQWSRSNYRGAFAVSQTVFIIDSKQRKNQTYNSRTCPLPATKTVIQHHTIAFSCCYKIPRISDLPNGHPQLRIEKMRYAVGETVRGNCTVPPGNPPANVTWTVNGKPVGWWMWKAPMELPSIVFADSRQTT